jgi:hypothetical protein
VFQYDEHEQHPQGDRRHREEIDRHQLVEVVMKKGLPRLVGGRRSVRSIRETVRLEISMPSIINFP